MLRTCVPERTLALRLTLGMSRARALVRRFRILDRSGVLRLRARNELAESARRFRHESLKRRRWLEVRKRTRLEGWNLRFGFERLEVEKVVDVEGRTEECLEPAYVSVELLVHRVDLGEARLQVSRLFSFSSAAAARSYSRRARSASRSVRICCRSARRCCRSTSR